LVIVFMDIVYAQPLKELLQMSSYFKEQIIVLVQNEVHEKKVKQAGLIPCYLIDEKNSNQIKSSKKKTAVLGGSVKANEFAVKIKADYLLQPSNTKQFFDLGLAKKLNENKTTVVLMFEEMADKNSFERHLFWKNYIEVVNYCSKKGTAFFVASGCKDPLHLRSKKVREALAIILGIKKEFASKYLEEFK